MLSLGIQNLNISSIVGKYSARITKVFQHFKGKALLYWPLRSQSSLTMGVFHSHVLEWCSVLWNTVLECLKGIFLHSSTALFWMEYFRNTVLSHWNMILLSAILNYVVIRLAGALHLDLFGTARTCSEEHGTLFRNIPLIYNTFRVLGVAIVIRPLCML